MRALRLVRLAQGASALATLLVAIGISAPAKAVTATCSATLCTTPGTYNSVSPSAFLSDSWNITNSAIYFGNAVPSAATVLTDLTSTNGLVNFASLPSLSSVLDIGSGISGTPGSTTGIFSLGNSLGSSIWGVTYGGNFLLLVFSQAINSITLNLKSGIHDVLAFNTMVTGNVGGVPLPDSLPLLGSVLGAAFLISRWRRKPRGTSRRKTIPDLPTR